MGGEMELGEGNAGGVGMGIFKKGSPGERFAIEVDADRSLMDFVGPLSKLEGGFAVLIGEDARDRSAVGDEMRKEAMLFEEALWIADRAGMALDEDASVTRGNDAGCREGARADGEDARGGDVVGKAREDGAQFIEGERRPVGLDPGSVDSVCSCRGCAHC